MGVEVVPAEMVQVAAETVVDNALLHEKESGKLDHDLPNNDPGKLGSVEEEPAKGEVNNAPNVNPQKDAVDEWPEAKRTYFSPFVRFSLYEDPKIKVKIAEAEKEFRKWITVRRELIDELRTKRLEKANLVSQRKALHDDLDQFRLVLGERKREIEPVEQLHLNNAGGRVALCSSEEELNDLIYSLQYRIQHESIPLAEEKKLIKEIRNIEATRNKVIENAAKRAQIQESMPPKENQLAGVNLAGVKKDQQATWGQIKQIKEKRKPLDSKILSLEEELTVVEENKKIAIEKIDELRKQQDENNIQFRKNLELLREAKHLAAKGDKISLEKLSEAEMEKFMSLWCSKSFRDDYEKRLLLSLDRRQFGRDGRMRTPGEKPLITPVARVPVGADMVAKASIKEVQDVKSYLNENKPSVQRDTSLGLKDQKAVGKNKAADSKSATDNGVVVDDEIDVIGKSDKKHNAREEVDAAKLKEMKREEEIAKAKQAMERKKKLVEKAAAKAAIKAQKEAEKKLKEREKREKKKAAATGPGDNPEESTEPLTEFPEAQSVDVNAEPPIPPSVQVKDKVLKEKAIRQRSRAKGPDPLPRAILKPKKSKSYWVWAAAALVVLMLLVFAYYYRF